MTTNMVMLCATANGDRVTKIFRENSYSMVALASHAFLEMDSVIRVAPKALHNQEEAILRILNGRHAPTFIDSWDSGELTALRRSYVRGRTLLELTQAQEIPHKESELLSLLCRITEALVVFHGEGIYHRDIKPENIVLGNDNQVYFVDWGAGLLWDADQPLPRFRVGTLQYAAPEVLAEQPYHPGQADVWSLGALFYVIASGIFPFAGVSPEAVLHDIASKQSGGLHLDSFGFLRNIVNSLLVYDPSSRLSLSELLTLMHQRIDRRSQPSKSTLPATFFGCPPFHSHSDPLPPVSSLHHQQQRKAHKERKSSSATAAKRKKRGKKVRHSSPSAMANPSAKSRRAKPHSDEVGRRSHRREEGSGSERDRQGRQGQETAESKPRGSSPKEVKSEEISVAPRQRTRAALSPSLGRFDFSKGYDFKRLTQAGTSSSEPLYLDLGLCLPELPQSHSSPASSPHLLTPKRRSRSSDQPLLPPSSPPQENLTFSVP